ncbi:IPT/TIG domain-containing protein, partial [Wenjunlia tyrosinilytica]|uniref:IPT/TIG domain-containing protein n=1 Tax=Wenjunlia tyrosinilytica TaxID=1544741 RepID=UPI0027E56EBD
MTPTTGPTTGGTTITLTGTGFTSATAVRFGTTPATSFTIVSDTHISAVSPAGTGTVQVTV